MEHFAGTVTEKIFHIRQDHLKKISRLFLVSTFIEDGIRTFFDLSFQGEIAEYNLYVPYALGVVLALLNGLLSLVGACLIIAEARAKEGCCMLLAVICLQFVMFDTINDEYMLPR